jgi:hypothetical protein
MTELSDFWEAKRRQLKHRYRDGSGEYAASCSLLAIDIAQLLEAEGKTPKLLSITGVTIGCANDTKPLIPVPYRDLTPPVIWGGHMICVAEGMAYDPMLEDPEPLESYPFTAFGEEILMTDRTDLLER